MQTRTFEYRKHIRWMQYPLVGILTFILVLPAAFSLIRGAIQGHVSLVWSAITILSAALVLLGFLGYRTIASTQITLGDEELHYRTFRTDLRLNYDEITALAFASIPYLGGWMKVKTPHQDIRLTVVVQDISELVRLLKARLDATGNENIYDREKLFGFYKTASFSDQSWTRTYRLFVPVVGGSLGSIALWFALSDPTTPTINALILGLGSLPLGGYVLTEFLLFLDFARQTDASTCHVPEVDPLQEQKRLRTGYGVYAALVLVLAFIG